MVDSQSTASIRVKVSTKRKLEDLRERLGLSSINDVIVLLLRSFEKHNNVEAIGK